MVFRIDLKISRANCSRPNSRRGDLYEDPFVMSVDPNSSDVGKEDW